MSEQVRMKKSASKLWFSKIRDFLSGFPHPLYVSSEIDSVHKYLMIYNFNMTSLLTHTVAHSNRLSFRPKINNQPFKKFLSLAVSWVKVAKNWKTLTFKVFYVKNDPNLSTIFFIEENHYRRTFFVIDIFWKLKFLNHSIS